ncbi:MAG: hypothetical protein ABI707_18990 [Ferruginibacter sp.]
MKTTAQFLQLSATIFLWGATMFSCKKNFTPADPIIDPPSSQAVSINSDTISNHLRFFGAVKKQGTIPKGPAGSSLKISFKDTLSLVSEIKRPIRFLHKDTTKNVAGVYLQVHYIGAAGGSLATYYYDVPEVPDVADNDTVSVILIGVDPKDLHPLDFDITIIPYDPFGQPLGETTRPVKIDEFNNDPLAGSCGLVLPTGEYWTWDMTFIENQQNNTLSFYNDPDKKWGAGGQFINGCCIDGISSYNTNCSGDTAHYRKLSFPTFFVFVEEILQFFNNGEFQRHTQELHSLPDPDKSDFCGSSLGIVHWSEISVYYFGNWSVQQLNKPFKGDSLKLTLLTTSTTGGTGYGNPGGIIHQLDCNTLALIRPDQEGGSQYTVSFFARSHTSEEEGWYVLL